MNDIIIKIIKYNIIEYQNIIAKKINYINVMYFINTKSNRSFNSVKRFIVTLYKIYFLTNTLYN